jgi:pimeloyl-ACP methyl ester carboxylesterase
VIRSRTALVTSRPALERRFAEPRDRGESASQREGSTGPGISVLRMPSGWTETECVPVPETHYAKSAGVHIAYQVVGSGPFDLVFIPGFVSHLEVSWEQPAFERFIRRLAAFSRVILVEKRGTGLSDPVPLDALPTLEQRMDDLRAVLEAVDSERAALFGISEGCAIGALFAATHPTMTTALVLYGGWARTLWAPDYPWGTPPETFEQIALATEQRWGRGLGLELIAPSLVADDSMRRWWARWERLAASPAVAAALLRLAFEGDVRDVLPALRVPTLVLHRADDHWVPVEHGRYLGKHIPGAIYVELPGSDHTVWIGDQDAVLQEIEHFLTGTRPAPEPDRVLATVLFTDIVDSTKRAASLGDREWRDLLARHHAVVRDRLARFRGREVDTTGDGFLAIFDGPARAIRCAHEMVDAVRMLGIDLRAGLHTGEIELTDGDVQGIGVHIGARVSALAGAGEVLVSSTVKDLVTGSGIEFQDRGFHALKGVPGDWHLFAVKSA